MALLYWNKKSLQNQAIIWFKDVNKEFITVENHEKYSLIKEKQEIVGINIKNASLFLNLKEGAQCLTKEIIDSIKIELNISLENINISSMLIVGEIIERKPHPKSKKLFLLKVKADKELNIVTNTFNSVEGVKIVVAKIGAILPSGMVIKPTKIMDVPSEGMLCGSETLGFKKTEGAYIVTQQNVGEEFIL